MSWAVLNGDFIKSEDARIAADDRGFLLGDGLFETLRSYNSTAFRLDDHLDRLFGSLAAFRIEPAWTPNDISGFVSGLIEKNGLESARVRITVSRGRHTGSMGLASTALATSGRRQPGGRTPPGSHRDRRPWHPGRTP